MMMMMIGEHICFRLSEQHAAVSTPQLFTLRGRTALLTALSTDICASPTATDCLVMLVTQSHAPFIVHFVVVYMFTDFKVN